MSKPDVYVIISFILIVVSASALYADVDLRLNSVDLRTTKVYVGQRIYANFSVTTLAEATGDRTFWLDIDVLSDPNDAGSSVYSIGYGSGYFPPNVGETADNYYLSFELNAIVDPGHYYLHVTIIPASPPDTNPGDNAKSSTIPFNVPPRSGPADVLVDDCSIYNHYLTDRTQPISGTISYLNNSLSTANNVTVGVYLSLDAAITKDDIFIASEDIGTLSDPYYRTFNFSVPIDPDIPNGNYYAGAIISASNDSNSANNVAPDSYYPVLIGGPAKPKPGTLTVYISPTAVQEKAGWRLVGYDGWLKGGQSLEDLTPNEYTIEFRPVSGYRTPAKRTVQIKSGSGATLSVAYETEPITPIIDTFEALPSEVYPGEPARIVWRVKNAKSVNILPILGLRAQTGSFPIEAPESTTFKLTASNKDGSANATAKFRVIDSRKIKLFTSNSTESNPLHSSETVKLYWSTRGISDITIDTDEDGIADVRRLGPSGVREITMEKSGYVRLFGQSDRGNASVETYVYLTDQPVIRSFELPSGRVLIGEEVTLRWNIPGMQSATIEPFGITTDQEEGEYRFIANKSMKIGISATNQDGSVSKSRKLRVTKKGTDLVLQVNKLNRRKDGTLSANMGDESAFTADMTITNIGLVKAKNFYVSMFANGELVDRKFVKTLLRSGQTIDIQLSHMLPYIGGASIKIVVDAEGTLLDVNRHNNTSEFQLVAPYPKKPLAWITNVALSPAGMVKDGPVAMLKFRITQRGVKGKPLYYYRVRFIDEKKRGGEAEVARLDGYPDDRYYIGRNIDITLLVQLNEIAFDGRIEIMVMNVLEKNGFLDLSRTRSFAIPEIMVGN